MSNPIITTIHLHMRQTFSRSMFKFIMLATPIFSGLIFGFIYLGSSDYNMIAYVMIGTATTTMWNSICFSSAGDINRERFMGALEKLFLTPTSFIKIMGAKVVANTFLGFISMCISFTFVCITFNTTINIINPWLFFITTVVLMCSYGTLGLLISGILAISRKTSLLMNIIGFPVFILTGAVFPIDILPLGIRWISYILSPTYGVELLRYSLRNSIIMPEQYLLLTVMIVLTLCYFYLSLKTYRYMDKKVRNDGTLELF